MSLFAILLASIAAIQAASEIAIWSRSLFFIVPLAMAATEWDTAKLLERDRRSWLPVSRLPVYWSRKASDTLGRWLAARAAIVPFFVLLGRRTELCAELIRPRLDELAHWARANTSKDAVFQFGDAERRPEPGIFRARAKRALYVDWKTGGQVNFLRRSRLWARALGAMTRQQPIEEYRKRGIDYVVLQTQTGNRA